jgi:hypothetical protein
MTPAQRTSWRQPEIAPKVSFFFFLVMKLKVDVFLLFGKRLNPEAVSIFIFTNWSQ